MGNYVPKYVQRRVRHSLTYLVILTIFMTFVIGIYRGGVHLAQLKPEAITIRELPSALILSFLRMAVSYVASLFMAFILGVLAARTKTGERIIIPMLDIFQSWPVVAFFPIAVSFFIGPTGESRIGIEAAAVFLIFTSQAWNLAFAVYEATKTIPQDQLDAMASLGVRGSQRIWKLYVPACIPRLVYNSILSWSNGWYFLVACEIIAIGHIRYHLPGIGSYLARAAEQDQIDLVLAGLVALTSMILILDFVLWRPLSIWAMRFRQDQTGGIVEHHDASVWMKSTFVQTALRRMAPYLAASRRLLKAILLPLAWVLVTVFKPLLWDLPAALLQSLTNRALTLIEDKESGLRRGLVFLSWALLGILVLVSAKSLLTWLMPPWPELAREIPLAILASTARLVAAMILSLLWVIPVVALCWNRPRLRVTLTTIAQIGASLPAIALFPLIVLMAVNQLGGGMEVASILLLLTGMQWYLLFNALSGTSIIPSDLIEASRSLGLTRMQTLRKLVLPAIRPALITGGITAWGGGWNALVVSEYVAYKNEILVVHGIGSLLNRAVYQLGDSRAIAVCVAAMVGWILLLNRLVWKRLYQEAVERYRFEN